MDPYDFESFICVRTINGYEYQGHCPFHDDKNPSFSVNIMSGLWKCHAGCGGGNFEQFLQRIKNEKTSNPSGQEAGTKYLQKYRPTDWSEFKKIATYEYQTEELVTHLRVTRFEDRYGNKRFLQEHRSSDGHWLKGGAENQVSPYRYGEWKSSSEPIFLVEGEKCVHVLWGMGFKATTVAGGSGGWRSWHATYFKSHAVVILPDHDDPGMKFAVQVFKDISQVARSVRMVSLPGLDQGEDVVDWFRAGNTVSDFNKLVL